MRAGQPRQGFTLIEMLVALALTLFIMVVIAEAFTAGLDTFRGLKGIGDMQESLRLAGQRLRKDLDADHFEGKRRLSDESFWATGPPRRGFFRIYQGSAGSSEGRDLDGLPSVRAVNHRLHFSVKLRGNRPGDFFSATIPATAWATSPFNPSNNKASNFFDQPYDSRYQQGTSYNSQWAEVAYYLEKTGTTFDWTDPGATLGTPLYSLYRVQRLIVAKNSEVNGVVPGRLLPAYAEFSAADDTGTLHFHTPENLASGDRAFDYATSRRLGASLLMTNVVSFRVTVLKQQVNGGAVDNDFSDIGPPFPAVYDTAGGNQAQRNYAIRAIRIVIRVWDEATTQSRQATVIQEM